MKKIKGAHPLRGNGIPVTALAVAGALGIVSGFAMAAPGDGGIRAAGGNPPAACGTTVAQRIDAPVSGQNTNVTVIGGATLSFTFDSVEGGPYGATWTADAPFTGSILVKAGSEQSGGGETTFFFTNATAGTIFSPFTNQNGQTQRISHVDVCGTGTAPTTTTTNTVDTTIFTTLPNTTTVTTLPNTTVTTTLPDTTTATTLPDTTTATTLPDVTTTTDAICDPQASVDARSLTTSTVPGNTITQTQPGQTITDTQPGTTVTQTQPGNTITQTQPGQTITDTQPGTTVTQTQPGNTITQTQPGSTIVNTLPGSTTTVTNCTTSTVPSTSTSTSTGSVPTTTTSAGGSAGQAFSGGDPSGSGSGEKKSGSAAQSATAAPDGLPFTGFHAPLLALVGLVTAATGLVVRRRLQGLS